MRIKKKLTIAVVYIFTRRDFNVNLINNLDSKTSPLVNLMLANHGLCVICKPTRLYYIHGTATLIDHVWTSDIANNDCNHILWDDISDHFAVLAQFHITNPNQNDQAFISRRRVSPASLAAFKDDLLNVDWNPILHLHDANEAYNSFFQLFWNTYDRHFPKTQFKVKSKPKPLEAPYITPEIKNLYREKRRLHRLAKKWPVTYKDIYIDTRNNYNSSVKRAREAYYRDKLVSSSGDSKSTW